MNRPNSNTSPVVDPVDAFLVAMAAAGITTDHTPIPDGELHRFDVDGDRKGSRNGWYVLHGDSLPTGVFGHWRTGKREVWSAKPRERMMLEERRQYARSIEVDQHERDERRAREGKHHRRHLNEVWREALPLAHPEAEPARAYLRRRLAGHGLWPFPGDLRYHPNLLYWHDDRRSRHPALLAMIRDHDGRPVSIHRTYLASDGCKADVPSPKKIMAVPYPRSVNGAAIRLYPAGDELIVSESLETAFSVHLALKQPCWAAISANGLKCIRIPQGVRRVIVAADHDLNGTGQEAGRTLEAVLRREGRTTEPKPNPRTQRVRQLEREQEAMSR